MHALYISTDAYQFAHGKQPRGYGLWAFFFDSDPEPFWFTGKYSEAKRSAIALAVSRGHQRIELGS